MFNTTIHKHETKVTPVTRVVEKTITPDKITDMYAEVRKEVEDTFLRGFRVEDNTMKGVVVEFAPNFFKKSRLVATRFVLNGKEHIYQDEFAEDYALDKQSAVEKLREYYHFELEKTLTLESAKVTSLTS